MRCNLSFVAKILEALSVLPFEEESDGILYGQIESFILTYLDQTNKVILTDDLAKILTHVCKVRMVDEQYFSKNLINKFEKIFMKNTVPNELGFTIQNVQQMFESFEEMGVYENREALIGRVQECYVEYNDLDDEARLKIILQLEKLEALTPEIFGYTIYYL